MKDAALDKDPQSIIFKVFTFYVKDCGMGEKKEGKEKEKCSTMPDVLIKGYKILRTVSVGQDFSGQHQRFALRQTQWDEEERGDKRRRKTIRKRERQRG